MTRATPEVPMTSPDRPRLSRADAEALARSEMDRCGLDPARWSFAWNRRKTALGVCHWNRVARTGRVELSEHIVNLDAAEVLDTIRHEIAHALDFDRRGTSAHDHVWRQICREVGAKPQAQSDVETIEMAAPKYLVTCECGVRFGRHSRPRNWQALRHKCSRSRRGALTWEVLR